MTCFWDGLMRGLQNCDFEHLHTKKTNRIELIKILQKNNKETINVLWNKNKLNTKELKDNFTAVKQFNIKGIHNGHLCSTCDYMLLLICELFNVNIYHTYLKNTMKYEKKSNKVNLYFQSNKGHFWFKSRKSI